MLKYQMATNDVRSATKPVSIVSYTVDDEYSDDEMLVTFYSDEDIPIAAHGHVVFNMEMQTEDFSNTGILVYGSDGSVTANDGSEYIPDGTFVVPSPTPDVFREVMEVRGVNKDERTFTMLFKQRYEYRLNTLSRITDNKGEVWWYFYVNGKHYFRYADTPSVNIECRDENGDVLSVEDVEIQIVNISTFRLREADIPADIVSSIFHYTGAGDKNKDLGDHNVMTVSRDQFYLTDESEFTLQYDVAMAELKIPIHQNFNTDLLTDELLQEHFVDAEKAKAINSIKEMEKDVYHPVMVKSTDTSDSNPQDFEDCYKIKINLHFREHDPDNDWLAGPESYWNGVKRDDKGEVVMPLSIDETFNPIYNKANSLYKGVSGQSDLLYYLGFGVNDIRYQKNKLKKSFVRLMFYDSMNPADQNMLAYATVFIDSGRAFMTYVKNINRTDYRTKDKSGLTGARPDREPTGKDKDGKTVKPEISVDNVEDYRISSQFVIKGREHSDACSEGFYLYLWRDNFLGSYPQDIYMKVEFNHAGYGRTIPFMLPYWDKVKDKEHGNKGGIKLYKEILEEFSDDTKVYGIRKYLRYSYIRWKYRYDKKNERRIYYLDPETYGDNVKHKDDDTSGNYFTDNTIIFNLYEAKIGNPEISL